MEENRGARGDATPTKYEVSYKVEANMKKKIDELIMLIYLTMIENAKGYTLKFWQSLSFQTRAKLNAYAGDRNSKFSALQV